MIIKMFKSPLAKVAMAVALTFSAPAHAADFSDKQINLIVPFRAGGATDIWARFYAPLISDKLPGKPQIEIKNVPGAGSTTGGNQFQRLARPDGLTLIGISGSTILSSLLEDPRVQYDITKWHPFIASPTGGVVAIRADAGAKSLKDVKSVSVPLKYAGQTPTSLAVVALLAFDLLGWDVTASFGYKGQSDALAAFEKNEANIDYQTTSLYLTSVKPMVDKGTVIPLFSFGMMKPDGSIVRDPTFPDMPSFVEAYEQVHGKKPSGPAFEAWRALFGATYSAQKVMFLPEGTPADVVDAYAKAIQSVLAEPGFKEKAESELGSYEQLYGKAAVDAMKLSLNLSPEVKEWVWDWLQRKYNVARGSELN